MQSFPAATWDTQALAVDSTAVVSGVDHSLIQAAFKQQDAAFLPKMKGIPERIDLRKAMESPAGFLFNRLCLAINFYNNLERMTL